MDREIRCSFANHTPIAQQDWYKLTRHLEVEAEQRCMLYCRQHCMQGVRELLRSATLRASSIGWSWRAAPMDPNGIEYSEYQVALRLHRGTYRCLWWGRGCHWPPYTQISNTMVHFVHLWFHWSMSTSPEAIVKIC